MKQPARHAGTTFSLVDVQHRLIVMTWLIAAGTVSHVLHNMNICVHDMYDDRSAKAVEANLVHPLLPPMPLLQTPGRHASLGSLLPDAGLHAAPAHAAVS